MSMKAQQGFIDSLFKLANIPLTYPDYTRISRRAKQVKVSFKAKTRGAIQHLAIYATGLKVYGEGEYLVHSLLMTLTCEIVFNNLEV